MALRRCTGLPAIIALPGLHCTCGTWSMACSSHKRVQTFYRASGRKSISQLQHKTVHSLSTCYKRNLSNLRLRKLLGSSAVRVPRLRYSTDVLASQAVWERRIRCLACPALSVSASKTGQGPWALGWTGRAHLTSEQLFPSLTLIFLETVPDRCCHPGCAWVFLRGEVVGACQNPYQGLC